MNRTQSVASYLQERKEFKEPFQVSFLAAGEYNENYLVETPGERFVFRINHGSQLGLEDQIGYEFQVLKALAGSGVTPRPLFCDPEPPGLPGGVLMMEFLPGRPLDYDRDLDQAARILAKVHSLPPGPGLIVQADPVADIAAESLGLIQRYPGHPRQDTRGLLLDYHGHIMKLFGKTRRSFDSEPLVMVNTEVNSGNFLIGPERSYLVDWEKAVVSPRYQDLGHLMVATTTRWKTEKTLDETEKRAFLGAYQEESRRLGGDPPGLDELWRKSRIMERTILLRALSWCYMAEQEYASGRRPLTNPATLAKIREYLDEAECFLG